MLSEEDAPATSVVGRHIFVELDMLPRLIVMMVIPMTVMWHAIQADSNDDDGNIDLNDLRQKAAEHTDRLAALMVTYPSTHGVFEEGIGEIQ